MKILDRDGLDGLLEALRREGHELLGPRLRDGAIVYDRIDSLADLPQGWTDEQDGGRYRLRRRDDDALFGYAHGPQSWKKYLFPASQIVFRARRTENGFQVEQGTEPAPRRAFIGVRACELAAIRIQDKVFLGGPYVDAGYQARREAVFIVAVNCGTAGGTCFCTSMGTGPKAEQGFDLALTELLEEDGPRFLVEEGSSAGGALLDRLPHREATEAEIAAAAEVVERTRSQMGRSLDTGDIKELFYRNLEHPHWQDVADRCLSCGNCTLVCPTCFCTTVEDVTDLAGEEAVRQRHWDSCFNGEFSYIAGGSLRVAGAARYRQWITHKLASWQDQFGSSGCVGCGRCISWCPVGIDITEEAAALRRQDLANKNKEET